MTKYVIAVTWKDDGEVEIFSSVPAFVREHTDFSEDTIYNWLSRKNEPYDTNVVRLERKPIKR